MEKVLVLPLFLLLSALTGVCPRSPTEIYVKAGEMVALYCPLNGEDNHRDAELIWTSPTSQEMDQTPNMSSAEQRHRDLLVHGKSLVILNATANHQGNYSCSLGNSSRQLWFRVTVYTKQRNESTDPQICYTREVCRLICPNVNAPAATSNNDIWHKEGESSPKASNFSSVEEKDHGVYTCTKSYLYYGHIYNMTFTVVLDIQPKEKLQLPPAIISPQSGVIHVNLGSPKVIDCIARMYSDFDEVFWFSTDSLVETNSSFPVFYNYTNEINGTEIKMTASLVFKKVSDEDLLKNYTCKLQTITGPSTSVTISLSQKQKPEHSPAIISPQSGVIHVNLGSPKVIDCKALMYSDFDELFWLSTDSFVETNSSFPVFSNYTNEINGTEIKMTASLVFKKVSDEDLLKNYTCKLQTVTGRSTFVTISLSQKHSPSHVPLALGIVGFVVMILAVVVYVRFKMISMRTNQTILRTY